MKESTMALDVERIRKDFPILHQEVHGRPLVYLDSAATSQKPQVVLDVLADYYARDNAFYVAWDAISRDRDSFQRWIQEHVMESRPESFMERARATAATNRALRAHPTPPPR